MIRWIIDYAIRHRVAVIFGCVLVAALGGYSVFSIRLDAIPDLTDLQVIVKTQYPGQSPEIVEDQVTYPLTTALLSVPEAQAVRGFSMFGESYLYVIFNEGTDPYWARSRVLEYLSRTSTQLPKGVVPVIGPDASGVGWVFEYALVDRQHRHDLAQLRAIQDFYLKYELQGVPGVAEVASVGGIVRQYQVEVDPDRMAAFKVTFNQVAQAIRNNNRTGGGSVVELGRSEFMIRARGYLSSLEDFRGIPVAVSDRGVPVRLEDVARIATGPEPRRGVADLNGQGEVVGGIVVMRYDRNALDTVSRVRDRLEEIKAGLPPGVEIRVTYDRSNLIRQAIRTLRIKLLEEFLVVAIVCWLFLGHFRSAWVAIITLPLGILTAFVIMRVQGIAANIMSLGGIAIALGAMVDAAIVMIENMHKHLERSDWGGDYWEVARQSAQEVGPALFFSLMVITVSFLPVFALTGQEGKLFAPLAYTKTYAMAASALLGITLLPILMGYFIRGRISEENSNPLNRGLQACYRPVLGAALDRPLLTSFITILLLLSIAFPLSRIGSEFMPPLYEGDVLYMPTTLPGLSVDEAVNLLQVTDRLIRRLPEVAQVFGKAGRADTATDPAPLSMFETTITLKPQSEWPAGERVEDLIAKLDREVKLPGLSNAWGYPIRTRIDMVSTGIRTPLGIRVTGPDSRGIADLTERLEVLLKSVNGARSVFAERVAGGHYLDIQVNRQQAARYGVTISDLTDFVQGAVGGANVDTVVSGRERFSINLRYPRDLRQSLEALSDSRITLPQGQQVPLRELAHLQLMDGPAEIRSENARLAGYVYITLRGNDMGRFVQDANQRIAKSLRMPPGYALKWVGQYENLQHAKQRLALILPLTLGLIALLLYQIFGRWPKVVLVMLCLPFSLVGGVWLVYALGYAFSVAVAIGFIALAGVAAEFGVVMILYLDRAVLAKREAGEMIHLSDLRAAVTQGAIQRLRPKTMTVFVIVSGLMPVLLGEGVGADVMKRVAAPLVGGMTTAPLLSLLVIPTLYYWWQQSTFKGENA